ncbi:MAG: MFS transporter [Rhodospirillales bacterium]|nr:MAG: MFS transporter [Rhodospirillales bacterium]
MSVNSAGDGARVPSTAPPASATATPAVAAMPWLLLAAGCLGAFAATASGTTRAPFLLSMSADLQVSLVLIANLVSMTATAWGVTSLLAGIAADRWGRRPFLIGGPLALGLCMVAVAQADDYLRVAIWATLGGACSGLYMGTIFAEVAARAPSTHRGRALSWVMSGQSLTLVVGVPLAAWVGASLGWRGWHVCLAALAIAGSLTLWASTRGGATGRGHGGAPAGSFRGAFSAPVISLLSMGIAERICYGLVVIYFATFLQQEYKASLHDVAIPLVLIAMGNVIGTAAGGPLADRTRDRLGAFGLCMAITAFASLALFAWRPDMVTTVALGFVYSFINALGRPSLMAALADVPEDVRGTVMGLNGTCASIGWVGAAALGGWMFATQGFAGFGPLSAALALLGAALAFMRRGR